MFDIIKLKYFQGNQFIPDIPNAPMRSQFRGFPILKQCGDVDESVCPTGALKANPLSIDMGKCTLCGACKCQSVQFSNYYKLSSTDRNKLVITENMTPEEFEKAAITARKEIRRVFSKSLKLRQVSAAGCNGCEMELNACSNCNFDMGRFGGITGKMSPSAVLVIKNGQTKLVNVRNQDAVTKIIDMIPDLVDKFTAPKEDTDDMVSDEKAQEIAFGQDTL